MGCIWGWKGGEVVVGGMEAKPAVRWPVGARAAGGKRADGVGWPAASRGGAGRARVRWRG